MIAKVTIIDDNGNPRCAYELKPSRIYEGNISTQYIFEFEYNQLNYDQYKPGVDIVGKYQRIREIMEANLDDIHPLDRDPYRLSKIHEILLEGRND